MKYNFICRCIVRFTLTFPIIDFRVYLWMETLYVVWARRWYCYVEWKGEQAFIRLHVISFIKISVISILG